MEEEEEIRVFQRTAAINLKKELRYVHSCLIHAPPLGELVLIREKCHDWAKMKIK